MGGVTRISSWACLVFALFLSGCGEQSWNNPYPQSDANKNILYSSFSERPKHLDPIQSYSASEYTFIAQIYEPPLQYHYLKRPYTLVPLTTTEMPKAVYYDAVGNKLPFDVSAEQIAYTIYDIQIQPGIMYQPHPAFATDKAGKHLYDDLSLSELEKITFIK